MVKVAVSAAAALPVVDPTPPPSMNLPPAPPPQVFGDPVAAESRPEVTEPQRNQRMFKICCHPTESVDNWRTADRRDYVCVCGWGGGGGGV